MCLVIPSVHINFFLLSPKILFPRTRRVTFSHFSASNALILFIQIEAISSSVRVYLKALVCLVAAEEEQNTVNTDGKL